MTTANWRTINVDLLDPESPANFSTSSLIPAVATVSASEVQTLSGQIRQLLRGGDTEGALRGALENVPYAGDAGAKVIFIYYPESENPLLYLDLYSMRRNAESCVGSASSYSD